MHSDRPNMDRKPRATTVSLVLQSSCSAQLALRRFGNITRYKGLQPFRNMHEDGQLGTIKACKRILNPPTPPYVRNHNNSPTQAEENFISHCGRPLPLPLQNTYMTRLNIARLPIPRLLAIVPPAFNMAFWKPQAWPNRHILEC